MSDISLAKSISVEPLEDNKANIVIEPCFPGYGLTLGNALRRVLLSSLPGAAVTEMKIKGVQHEFSTIPHIKEDAVEIILNVKSVRAKLLDTDKTVLKISTKGKKVVKASDLGKNAQVEIMNPDQVICTLTDEAASLDMELTIEAGLGYLPVETRKDEAREIGRIQVDAVFSAVQNVSFSTEHVRVGDATNYDKVVLVITTDGTITPEEAFSASANILVEQFTKLAEGPSSEEEVTEEEAEEVTETEEED